MLSFLQSLYHSPEYLSNIHFYLLVGHVALAIVAIIVGPIPMIVRKGGKNHRLIGKIFLWSMLSSLIMVILIMIFFRFNAFLAGITALSLNGVVTGARSLYRKRPEQNKYIWFDWGFAIVMLAAGIGLVCYGLLTSIGIIPLNSIPSGGSQYIVLTILPIVFGILTISDTLKDIKSLRTPSTDRNWWWYYHMDRMLGSYVALISAFTIQQIGPRLPASVEWLAWIVPTIIGAPLIAIWIKSYRRQFNYTDQSSRNVSLA